MSDQIEQRDVFFVDPQRPMFVALEEDIDSDRAKRKGVFNSVAHKEDPKKITIQFEPGVTAEAADDFISRLPPRWSSTRRS
ncbi:MAG TPA: hypothetical protein VLH19_03935 [Patescibacteria group bacterium]|nr:hypothetical protein [Patescibacteria group bacterium]